MSLSGKQIEEIHHAFLDAFPNEHELQKFIEFRFNQYSKTIAGGDNLEKIVYRLIETAWSDNSLEDLVIIAHNYKPKNEHLLDLLKGVFLKSNYGLELDYIPLRELLMKERWEDANRLTFELLIILFDSKDVDTDEDCLNCAQNCYFCTDLETINSLWLKYSKDVFGFSVQKEIYLNLGGLICPALGGVLDSIDSSDLKKMEETIEKFSTDVGWMYKGSYLLHRLIFANIDNKPHRNKKGHLPLSFLTFEGNGRAVWYQSDAAREDMDKYKSEIDSKIEAEIIKHDKEKETLRIDYINIKYKDSKEARAVVIAQEKRDQALKQLIEEHKKFGKNFENLDNTIKWTTTINFLMTLFYFYDQCDNKKRDLSA